ncbi:MAG: hypothetical protein ACHREM_15840 [Polyangiales bacterium]
MFFSAFELDAGCAVLLHVVGGDVDADFEAMLAAIAHMDEALCGHRCPIAMQIVDDDVPVPDARWRRRLADATATLHSAHGAYLLVTPSTAVRGAVTAINWLRPPPCEFAMHTTVAQAVAWAEERRGEPIPALFNLEARVRRASMRTSTRPPPMR